MLRVGESRWDSEDDTMEDVLVQRKRRRRE